MRMTFEIFGIVTFSFVTLNAYGSFLETGAGGKWVYSLRYCQDTFSEAGPKKPVDLPFGGTLVFNDGVFHAETIDTASRHLKRIDGDYLTERSILTIQPHQSSGEGPELNQLTGGRERDSQIKLKISYSVDLIKNKFQLLTAGSPYIFPQENRSACGGEYDVLVTVFDLKKL